LEVFWKINAISTEFGDFRTHVAIYWKTNQHAIGGLQFNLFVGLFVFSFLFFFGSFPLNFRISQLSQ
jgi:hypothetical protein